MVNALKALLVLSVALISAGCASLTNGSQQTVTIDSNVKGADVYVNGNPTGKTPFTGAIQRGGKTTVTLKKEGYKETTVTLATEVEGIFWGNIIIGGVLGSTTDSSTGAMYKYAPASITIEMQDDGSAQIEDKPSKVEKPAKSNRSKSSSPEEKSTSGN